MDPIQAQLVEARREQILEAATAVFAARGFHKATIRAIAQQAGIADGTIYNYFKNKDELLLGILDRLNETDERAAALAEGSEAADFRSFMHAYLRHRIALLWPNAQLFQAVLPELLNAGELRERYLAETLAPTLAVAEAQFEQLMALGVIRPLDIPLAVRTVAATLFGLLVMTLLGDEVLAARWGDLPDVVAAVLLDGLDFADGTSA